VATSGAGGPGCSLSRLEPNVALVVVAIWLSGALLVTTPFTERAEISG